MARFRVALLGQPNCGKSTIFNLLSGAKQHIANYPGITVDKKSAEFKLDEHTIELIDLPGTYSLSSYSDEESVATSELVSGNIDLVINIMDASNFKRNLYLTTQLTEVGIPTIVFLNMMDVADDRGMEFDIDKLSKLLNCEVVAGVGYKSETKNQLLEKIKLTLSKNQIPSFIKLEGLEDELEEFSDYLLLKSGELEDFPLRWLSIRLLEGDALAKKYIQKSNNAQEITGAAENIKNDIESRIDTKLDIFISSKRYDFSEKIEALTVTKYKEKKKNITNIIDKVVLNRFLSLPIMLGIIFLLYELSIVQGYELTNYTWPLLASFKQFVVDILPASGFIEAPIVREFGIWMVNSVNALLNYIPIFIILFTLIALLEDSGYMARMAFVLDRIFRNYGLHGQSTLPYVLSGVFVGGCAVPGIMATKGIPDPRAKMATILTVPFLNCLAKIPFFVLIVSIFFIDYKSWVMFFISTITIIVALIVAKILTITVLRHEKSMPFILEMPNYHMPRIKNVFFSVKDKIWLYIKKVMTIVVAVAAVLFVLIQFPGVSEETKLQVSQSSQKTVDTFLNATKNSAYFEAVNSEDKLTKLLNFEESYKQKRMNISSQEALNKLDAEFKSKNETFFKILRDRKDRDAKIINRALKRVILYRKSTLKLLNDEKIDNSYLGRIGKSLEGVTQYAGFDWRINVAFLSSFAARESFVATLGALFEGSEADPTKNPSSQIIDSSGYTQLAALAMIIFMALTPPCIATLIVIKAQTNSYKWMLFALLYPIVIGLVVAMTIYSGGSYLELSAMQVMWGFYAFMIAILLALGVVDRKRSNLTKRSIL
ncbi:MAG: ferrous iron transport protein B [Campylobacterales bacterium]